METLTPSTFYPTLCLFSTKASLMNVENLLRTLLKLFTMQPFAHHFV